MRRTTPLILGILMTHHKDSGVYNMPKYYIQLKIHHMLNGDSLTYTVDNNLNIETPFAFLIKTLPIIQGNHDSSLKIVHYFLSSEFFEELKSIHIGTATPPRPSATGTLFGYFSTIGFSMPGVYLLGGQSDMNLTEQKGIIQ